MTSTSSRQFAEDEEECDLRRSFNAQLEAFLRRRCNGIVVMPSINGRRIDLYRLYRKVVQMGGWTKVSSMGKWNQVLPVLGIGSNCLCGDYGARTIYMRYLARYEQKQLFGSESDDDDEFSSGTGGVRSGRGRSSNHYFSASRLPDVSTC
ncbi:ARID/BRIGHT DNA binding domain protein [Trichuris suis]|nr:ARID/BRIGHT DNA binding domain protein [Trichuris suis]